MERFTYSPGTPQAQKLPDGAVERWFDDRGIMRRGFIMPDGTAYIINREGVCVEVNTGRYDPPVDNDPSVVEYEPEGTVQTPINQDHAVYNVPAIVISILLILGGIYLVYDGATHLNNANGYAGQLYGVFYGSHALEQAKQGDTIEIVGGIAAGGIGLMILFKSYRNDL